ncbi:hypothetical protein PVK06_032178 [Gossypium arboreum]|uniref:Uncharacterized protein n=1 Tax=Gossypium arboreum TaxID=29729 RepID=A0ABR0NTR7_GOSAR|nr:hypothetical protein PVK06_032178 [Gossypium arboreum]
MDSATVHEEIDSLFESTPPLKDSAKIIDKLNQVIQFDSPSAVNLLNLLIRGKELVCSFAESLGSNDIIPTIVLPIMPIIERNVGAMKQPNDGGIQIVFSEWKQFIFLSA